MDILLFASLGVLLLLQLSRRSIPRVIMTFAVIGLTAHNVLDYQLRMRTLRSEQESIAKLIQRDRRNQNPDSFRAAADRYFEAKARATRDDPFDRSFYYYLLQETQKR